MDEGQTVAASFNTPTLFTIANDLTRMQVIANVDEADIGEVKDGQKVTFTVDAYPEDTFTGSVTQVRLQPTTTSNVVTYEVVVGAPNPDLKLKPGLTANITITTLEKDSILLVPVKALRFTPEQKDINQADINPAPGKKILWKEQGKSIMPVNVSTGVSDGIYTEVSGNIREGDTIITGIMLGNPAKTIVNNGTSSPFMPKPPGQEGKKQK